MEANSEIKTKKRLGVIRGGEGEHYISSLKKGGEIILHINDNLSDTWKVSDILIDHNGVWHFSGVPIVPAELASKVDLVWDTTFPGMSNTLKSLSIPSIGNDPFFSALEKNNDFLKNNVRELGISMPRSIVLPLYQEDFDGPRERYSIKKAKEVHEKFGAPWLVKSFTPDSNMGIHLAKTFGELAGAIEDGVKHDKSILVQEFIAGKVASVHSIPNFRSEKVYTFPLGNSFGNFSSEEKEKLINTVKGMYSHLGAKHYLKSDFVLNTRGKIYLFGIGSHPDLNVDSHFSQVCELIGIKASHVVDHILEKATYNL
ncbi:MAG: hypothetical protein ABIS26_00095 [Candidatus Paceibacterota bacterium]